MPRSASARGISVSVSVPAKFAEVLRTRMNSKPGMNTVPVLRWTVSNHMEGTTRKGHRFSCSRCPDRSVHCAVKVETVRPLETPVSRQNSAIYLINFHSSLVIAACDDGVEGLLAPFAVDGLRRTRGWSVEKRWTTLNAWKLGCQL